MREVLVEFLTSLEGRVVHWSQKGGVKTIEDGLEKLEEMPLAEWMRYWWPEVHGALISIDADQKYLDGAALRAAAVSELSQLLADAAMGVE